jgi:hypothetical protein
LAPPWNKGYERYLDPSKVITEGLGGNVKLAANKQGEGSDMEGPYPPKVTPNEWDDWLQIDPYKGDTPPTVMELQKKYPQYDSFGHLPGEGKRPGTIWMRKHKPEDYIS